MVKGRAYNRGEIARGTGYTLSAISRIFGGKRAPTMRTATKLASFFGITLDELMSVLGN
ncbi:MAG: helix-turn-helix transcriptional regulator [Acidobacteriia bacterium]|nr:helix-turn-helix transcriptional regulator [Terriglobia bacterium]